jgi:radical SAM superfamily enzyme YgiQ (UPF0313 family)
VVKKLLLINPRSEDNVTMDVAGFSFPPPALAYLAALTPSNWDMKILDENVEPDTFEDADLVGITAMTSNAPRAYRISELYRKRGIKTVIGGIHASMLFHEAAKFVDSVVIGEAESVWQDLVYDFESNKLQRLYIGGRASLQNLVKPRNDLYSSKYRVRTSVQTARGCPYDCEFCSVTAFHGRTYRQRPVEEVLDELEALDCREFFFSDDNILGHGEEAAQRSMQLFRGMKERKLNKHWVSQAGVDIARDTKVLEWAKESGCMGVSIGFESLTDESLKEMHKVRNLKIGVHNYKEIIHIIQDHGIRVLGGFVLGNDGDRKDVFQRTAEFILDSKMDSANITILTPLPGTRLYRRLEREGRLLRTNFPDDWKHYDMGEAVFKPKHFTAEELEEGAYLVYRSCTSIGTSLTRAFNTFIQTRNLPLAYFIYSLNRGYATFATKKYQYVKCVAS